MGTDNSAPTYPTDISELADILGVYRGERRPDAGMTGIQGPLADWLDEHGDNLLAELELHRTRDMNPDPAIWPECDVNGCGTPFQLTRFISFGEGRFVWRWKPGCKHKTALEHHRFERRDEAGT